MKTLGQAVFWIGLASVLSFAGGIKFAGASIGDQDDMMGLVVYSCLWGGLIGWFLWIILKVWTQYRMAQNARPFAPQNWRRLLFVAWLLGLALWGAYIIDRIPADIHLALGTVLNLKATVTTVGELYRLSLYGFILRDDYGFLIYLWLGFCGWVLLRRPKS